MTELTFLKILMLKRQMYQHNALFAIIGIFQVKGLSFNQMSAMGVMMYNDVNEHEQYCFF